MDGPNYFRENFLTVASLQPSAEDLRISAVWIFMAGESVSVFCHPPPPRVNFRGKARQKRRLMALKTTSGAAVKTDTGH